MKKKSILALGLAALAIVSGYGGMKAYDVISIQADNRLLLANVEALSANEGNSQTVSCYCKTKIFSPNVCSANASGNYCGGDPCSNHDSNCR